MTVLDLPEAQRPAATDEGPSVPVRPAGSGVETAGLRLGKASGVGLGTAVIWLSLLVLLPLAAVATKAFSGGWSQFWDAVTVPATKSVLEFTVASSLIVTLINAVMGTLIA